MSGQTEGEVGCAVTPLWWLTHWETLLAEQLGGCCVFFVCLHESPEGEQWVLPAVLNGNPFV